MAAFRSVSNTTYASRTNTTVTAPAGIADDDILVLFMFLGVVGGAPTPTPPSGFTQIGSGTDVTDPGNFNGKSYVWWKRASSEGSDYTITHTGANTQAVIAAYSGCTTSGSPVDALSSNTGAVSSAVATAVTTTVGNTHLLYLAHDWTGSGALTPPTGMGERFDGLVYLADEAISSTGATGDRTQTNGNSAAGEQWAAWLVALKPAATQAPLTGTVTTAAKLRSGFSGMASLQGRSSLEISASADLNQQSSPTSEPVLVSATSTAFNNGTTPKTASGISVQNGDVLLAHAMAEVSGGDTISIATTAGNTDSWTLLEDVPGITEFGQAYLRTWWTTATATGTVNIQFSATASPSDQFGGIVKVYRNSGGVGTAVGANNGTGSGAPSVSITITRDHSVLDFASADWNAAAGTATFTSSAGTPVQDLNSLSAGAYRVYSSHVNAGGPGSKTIGISAPSGQRYVASAVEVFGQGAVGLLVARATVASRGRSTFSGRSTLATTSSLSMRGSATASGRVPLAAKATSALKSTLVQSVALAFQTRFFPAMRGTLTTVVSLGSSAGSATKFSARGDATARAALAGKAASAARSTAGVGANTSLSGAAKVSSSAKGTATGRVVLAIQTRILPAMRGALNAAVVPTSLALAATAGVVTRARAAFSGRTSMEGATSASSRARSGLSAIAAITGRTTSQATGAAPIAARTALAAAATVRPTIRGLMIGRVAMFGRAAVSMASRATLPGTVVELFARATTAARIATGLTSRASLSGRSTLTVKTAAQPPLLAAFLAGVATVAAKARAGTSAAVDFTAAARTKIAVSARSTFSGVVSLGASVKARTAAKLNRPLLPLAARAVMRTSARALLFVLAPVITPPANGRPSRLSRLNASLLKAFGEAFDIKPMTAAVDVNSRLQADISRTAKLDISGIWDGPTTSRTPHARGALQDDNAHNWNASYPSANFDDSLVAGVRKGDVLTRKLDGAVYEVARVVPDGFGRTTLQLSKRKRT
jgi:hypothetical protein